jgi:hypothetical protein
MVSDLLFSVTSVTWTDQDELQVDGKIYSDSEFIPNSYPDNT